MTRTETRGRFSYLIADSRESQVLMDFLPDLPTGLTRAVEQQGLTMQRWLKDDELVVTFCKRGRLTAQDVASRVNCDPHDLEEAR